MVSNIERLEKLLSVLEVMDISSESLYYANLDDVTHIAFNKEVGFLLKDLGYEAHETNPRFFLHDDIKVLVKARKLLKNVLDNAKIRSNIGIRNVKLEVIKSTYQYPRQEDLIYQFDNLVIQDLKILLNFIHEWDELENNLQ
jgi:hypothetical protein